MSHFDEWVEDYLPASLQSKLERYDSFGSFRGKSAEELLKFLTPNELKTLRARWPIDDPDSFPFLWDASIHQGAGI